jgi:PIN domain
MSSNFTVLYDANIFFGAFRRNVMIHLAQAGIYRAKWTEDIHQEWMSNLRKKYPDIGAEKVQKIRGLIDAAVPDCLVNGYRRLITGLELPDSNDRHVLAAAIKAGAQVLVTCNTDHLFSQHGTRRV